MVYATALRVVRGQESLAEDVAQAVLARLAAAPEKVRNPRALGAWLHAATTGIARDALRREVRRRRRERTAADLAADSGGIMPAVDSGRATPIRGVDAEIDRALGELPSRDSRLLILRFWHGLDWQSIGRDFGVSGDAAQKRMSRALGRLRRILTRRGITGSAGSLCAALMAATPRSLNAAVASRLLSTVSQSRHAAAVSTTLAMTTRTNSLLAAAIAVAAAVPLVCWQLLPAEDNPDAGRIVGTSGPGDPRVETVNEPPLPADGRGAIAGAVPKPDSPAVPQSDAEPDDSVPAVDVEALGRAGIAEKVAALRGRLGLTPDQEDVLARALELGRTRFRISPPNVIPVRPTPDELEQMEAMIRSTLTPGQQEEYDAFRAEEMANSLEAAANRDLSRLQSLLTLTDEQKDEAFALFSDIASRETGLPVLDPAQGAAAIREAERARWLERRQALSSILTP